MKRKQALAELIAKVEVGFDPEDRPSAFKALRDPDYAAWAVKAHKGSLDAAKALHEAVLPGWSPSVGQNVHHGYWFATVMRAENGTIAADTTGTGPCPARAWLLAILRALHSMEPDA